MPLALPPAASTAVVPAQPVAPAPPKQTLLTLESETAPWAVTDEVLRRELMELRALQAVAPVAQAVAPAAQAPSAELAASETTPAADTAGTAAPSAESAPEADVMQAAAPAVADVAAATKAAKRRARELKRLGDTLSAGRCATWWRRRGA